jgi:hypothetical protein
LRERNGWQQKMSQIRGRIEQQNRNNNKINQFNDNEMIERRELHRDLAIIVKLLSG